MRSQISATVCYTGIIALAWVLHSAGARADTASRQDFAKVERGRYLTAVADCAACHTDAHGAPFAGGKPIETPFGNVLAANITPDPETGIGNWTERDFEAALRQGRLPDGERLYPAMPYPYYTKLSDSDVRDILAYLRTLTPVRHAVQSNQLPFPYNIRTSMRFWDWLYFDPGRYQADPARSAGWNRGAYLVLGPGHCAACHTPKTRLGGDEKSHLLQGYSLQGWFAPNITNDVSRGLGGWSSADIVEYLHNGHNRFAGAAGPMADEVRHSGSEMTQPDLQAIAEYLKGQAGQAASGHALAASDARMKAGSAIYKDLCAACHRDDGHGVPYLIPDLASSAAVASREPTSVLRVIIQGTQTVGTKDEPTAPAMPGFGWQLTDAQIAAVSSYVRNSWGHAASATSASEVGDAREHLQAAR
jgi:mono/diheme cytochrome c family protein